MRKGILSGMLLALVLTPWAPSASAADAAKIGVVDVQKIVFQSKVGQAGIAKIKEFQEERQKTITEKERDLLKVKQEFESQQFTLTDAAKKLQRDQITEQEINLKRLLEDSDRELRVMRNDLLERINREVLGIIQTLGQQRGFSIIVDKESLLYAASSVDITDEVIKSYDESK